MNIEALCVIHFKQTKTDLAKPETKKIETIQFLVGLIAHCFLLSYLSTFRNFVNTQGGESRLLLNQKSESFVQVGLTYTSSII